MLSFSLVGLRFIEPCPFSRSGVDYFPAVGREWDGVVAPDLRIEPLNQATNAVGTPRLAGGAFPSLIRDRQHLRRRGNPGEEGKRWANRLTQQKNAAAAPENEPSEYIGA